ncbi:MAG: hypothetical protein Q8N63_03820 [Nanoarchaeota archaeon]|nr:hypothetical protein [Nanoarchaeota archaeon]
MEFNNERFNNIEFDNREFNKKQKIFLVIGSVIVLILVYYAITSTISSISGKAVISSETGKQVAVTRENLYLYIESQKMIQELPKDALISLKLYNFNTGVRQWEKVYLITKGNVEEVNEQGIDQGIDQSKLDAEIIIHSKYPLSAEFCTAIKQARANNDFAYELKASKASLLWKYKGMMKYKDCFE